MPTLVLGDLRFQRMTPGASVWCRDGLMWFQAPAPPRRHEHAAQSVALGALDGEEFWRCACGMGCYAYSGGGWFKLDDEPLRVAPEPASSGIWDALRKVLRRG